MKILIIISQNISVLASDDPNLSTFYRNEGKNNRSPTNWIKSEIILKQVLIYFNFFSQFIKYL